MTPQARPMRFMTEQAVSATVVLPLVPVTPMMVTSRWGKPKKRRRDLRQRLTGIRYPHHVRILRHVQRPSLTKQRQPCA